MIGFKYDSNGLLRVANAAARLILSPSDGDLVIQLDTHDIYQWNAGASTWQVVSSPSVLLGVSDTNSIDMSLAVGNIISGDLRIQDTTSVDLAIDGSGLKATVLPAGVDHNSLNNTHNLTTDIDHNSLTNTHNLTTNIDHGSISGLSDDDHTRYVNLVGRAGGQDIAGGTLTTQGLILRANYADLTGTINIPTNTTSTSSITGALTIAGGVGIAENLNVGGNVVFGDADSDTITIAPLKIKCSNSENDVIFWGGTTEPSVSGSNCIIIGSFSTSTPTITKNGVILIGGGNHTTSDNVDSIMLGTDTVVRSDYAIAIGSNASVIVSSTYAVSIGRSAGVNYSVSGVAIGYNSSASSANYATAIGTATVVSAESGTAIGQSATVTHANSTAIGGKDSGGTGVATTATNQIRIGTAIQAVSISGKLQFDSNSKTTGIKGSAAASASVEYSLPPADGSAGQVLATNGSGVLSWATASSGSVSKDTGSADHTNWAADGVLYKQTIALPSGYTMQTIAIEAFDATTGDLLNGLTIKQGVDNSHFVVYTNDNTLDITFVYFK